MKRGQVNDEEVEVVAEIDILILHGKESQIEGAKIAQVRGEVRVEVVAAEKS
jgi:hypothetical protein